MAVPHGHKEVVGECAQALTSGSRELVQRLSPNVQLHSKTVRFRHEKEVKEH